MNILITNDDGIHAPGILALAEAAQKFGNVKVFAPEKEKSSCGHSMSLHEPIRCKQIEWNGMEAYITNASPTDCVNVGLSVGWPDGCDLVLSGFNRGPNLGYDITYSGTVAGAMEGAIHGIKSFAFSMAILDMKSEHFYETGKQWLIENWEALMQLPQITPSFININVPSVPYSLINGIRFAKMGPQIYAGQLQEREDPYGGSYYWYHGDFGQGHDETGTDVEAIRNNFVSITPLSVDWTDERLLGKMETLFNGGLTTSAL
jgi:5'-nucleotidase